MQIRKSVRKTSIHNLKAELQGMLIGYYTHYYRVQLGLPDWESRVSSRLNEDQNFGEPMVRKVEEWLNYNFSGKKVLVVGTGTGAELLALISRGAKVRGIEPNSEALRIVKLKARLSNLRADHFISAFAEDMPFENGFFDFVYCYTVLEHVKDVERSIDEMIRVCKIGGLIFIQTPDYRFPSERHYKLALIPFGPRWAKKIYLMLRKRPTRFIDSINFLTQPKLDRIFWERSVITIRVYEPILKYWRGRSLNYWFSRLLNVPNQQHIFLRKFPE